MTSAGDLGMGKGTERAIRLYVRALDLSAVIVAARSGEDARGHIAATPDPAAACRRLGKDASIVKLFWLASDMQAMMLAEHVSRDLASIARPECGGWFGVAPTIIAESVASAARDLGLPLQVNEQVEADAATMIERIEARLKDMQRAGEMKSVNKAYQTYRLDATAQGKGAMAYAGWLENYKLRLVRAAANTARTLGGHRVQNGQ